MFNKDAIFCDESEEYRIPTEPKKHDKVRFIFRTSRTDSLKPAWMDIAGDKCENLKKKREDQYFSYYECTIQVGEKPILYCFVLKDEDREYYFDRAGLCEVPREEFAFMVLPGFTTPDWAKGAVMYQIFVDRFCRGDDTNNVIDDEYIYIGIPTRHITNWNELPSAFDVGYFYGGDLSGVWNKLDYLQFLGVECIYFNPLFVSPSNHKYDTQDYEHIDAHFTALKEDKGDTISEDAQDNGNATRYICRSADPENMKASDEFFANFVAAAHEHGIRVILDGVFNHCGSFNKWMDREGIYEKAAAIYKADYAPGAYMSADSPYRKYFEFSQQEEGSWPSNASYDGWWGNDTLPKLNYEGSEDLENAILAIAKKWVSPPFNADGWRLDVAADLGHSEQYNHSFWEKFRSAVKQSNPEAVIIAEHYGDPSRWLDGKQWDTIMNYDGFMDPVSWFLTGMEKHSDRRDENQRGNGAQFFESMRYAMGHMPFSSILTAMNELSNHDHSRFLTRTNHIVGRIATLGSDKASENVDVSVLRQAVLIQMTWPGAPTIYYADEAGQCGFTDPDSRRSYPWGRENLELVEFHRYITGLHKKSAALRRGSVIFLAADRDLIVYARKLGDEKAVIAVYTGQENMQRDIPVWLAGITDEDCIERVIYTKYENYSVGTVQTSANEGMLQVKLTKNSAVLFFANPPVLSDIPDSAQDKK